MKTHEEKLKDIRSACIACNEDIVKLQFGCEVDRGAGKEIKEIFISEAVGEISLMRRNRHGDWQPFLVPSNLKEDWKIIGHPIHLADILLAIKDNTLGMHKSAMNDGTCAWFIKLNEPRDLQFKATGKWWNLKQDDLILQPEETISFLHELLFGKQ